MNPNILSLTDLVEVGGSPFPVDSRHQVENVIYYTDQGFESTRRVYPWGKFSRWFPNLFSAQEPCIEHIVHTKRKVSTACATAIEQVVRQYTQVPTTKLFNGMPGTVETFDEGAWFIPNRFALFSKTPLDTFLAIGSGIVSDLTSSTGKAIAQFQIDMATNHDKVLSDLKSRGVTLDLVSTDSLFETSLTYLNRIKSSSANKMAFSDLYSRLFNIPGSAIILGDQGYGNAWMSEKGVGLHDFERVRLGNPIDDVAFYTLTHLDEKFPWFELVQGSVFKSYQKAIHKAAKENPALADLETKDSQKVYYALMLKNSIRYIGQRLQNQKMA